MRDVICIAHLFSALAFICMWDTLSKKQLGNGHQAHKRFMLFLRTKLLFTNTTQQVLCFMDRNNSLIAIKVLQKWVCLSPSHFKLWDAPATTLKVCAFPGHALHIHEHQPNDEYYLGMLVGHSPFTAHKLNIIFCKYK